MNAPAAAPAETPVPSAEVFRNLLDDREGAGLRYEVRERLGHGSLAVVFRAVDLLTGCDVALKVAASDSPALCRRIRTEAGILASFGHPSIIRLVGEGIMPAGGPFPGRPFLAEEMALGPTLRDAAAGAAAHPGQVALWARNLFEGLSHVHDRGLVHRDIKPANLMLSGLRRSPVRIVDFGIAVPVGSTPEAGVSAGTAHYMSPEQAWGAEPAQPAWDVYALGLVLLELLTGTKAYPGTSIESLVARNLRSPVIPPSLGPGWCTLLLALTAKDPAERPTAAEAAAMAGKLITRLDARRPRATVPRLTGLLRGEGLCLRRYRSLDYP